MFSQIFEHHFVRSKNSGTSLDCEEKFLALRLFYPPMAFSVASFAFFKNLLFLANKLPILNFRKRSHSRFICWTVNSPVNTRLPTFFHRNIPFLPSLPSPHSSKPKRQTHPSNKPPSDAEQPHPPTSSPAYTTP